VRVPSIFFYPNDGDAYRLFASNNWTRGTNIYIYIYHGLATVRFLREIVCCTEDSESGVISPSFPDERSFDLVGYYVS
jgi:hypothetical protein